MEDVCKFGHQLAPGSDPITITETDPETGRIIKKETLLLRRHVVVGTDGKAMTSEFRPGSAAAGYLAWAESITHAYDDPIATEGHKRAEAEKAAKAQAEAERWAETQGDK